MEVKYERYYCSYIVIFDSRIGQALAGDVKKGVIFFIIAIVLGLFVSLIFRQWLAYIINFAYAIYAAYDAYQMSL